MLVKLIIGVMVNVIVDLFSSQHAENRSHYAVLVQTDRWTRGQIQTLPVKADWLHIKTKKGNNTRLYNKIFINEN